MLRIGNKNYNNLLELQNDVCAAEAVLYRNSTVKIKIAGTKKKRDQIIKDAIKLAFKDQTAEAATKAEQLKNILAQLNGKDSSLVNKNNESVQRTKQLKLHQKIGRIFYKREKAIERAIKKLSPQSPLKNRETSHSDDMDDAITREKQLLRNEFDKVYRAKIKSNYTNALKLLKDTQSLNEGVYYPDSIKLSNYLDLNYAQMYFNEFILILEKRHLDSSDDQDLVSNLSAQALAIMSFLEAKGAGLNREREEAVQ